MKPKLKPGDSSRRRRARHIQNPVDSGSTYATGEKKREKEKEHEDLRNSEIQ